jgi:diaminopimelate epimerase
MEIPFTKYQGTGNDFVLVDQRINKFIDPNNQSLIQKICDRKFGVGADGLILLEHHQDHDYEMVYFNADGRTSSMCGNGGRCITAFAHQVGIGINEHHFLAIDGKHTSRFNEDGMVSLKMNDVSDYVIGKDFFILNTGSPHYIIFVEDIDDIDVKSQGEAIRYSEEFKTEGINVNFVEIKKNDHILVATYERGVEDETLSCGTGVTAAAIAYCLTTSKKDSKCNIHIETKGGDLSVSFEQSAETVFSNIWLNGKATKVFTGIFLDNY